VIVIFGNQLADLTLRLDRFPIEAGQMQPASAVDLGPGGAGNVAIACRRLGLEVACLAEVGEDPFGKVVRDGLAAESVDTRHLVALPETRTPLAAVLVGAEGVPSYLGYPGRLVLGSLPAGWRALLREAEAVFVDGWVEGPGGAELALEALATARRASVPTFFDPGPGNPAVDNTWQREALGHSEHLMLNAAEAQRLAGPANPREAARVLRTLGPGLVLIKLGAAGCLASRADELVEAPALPAVVVDTTGAGDTLDAAVIYAALEGLDLRSLALLANAAGAAKVQKLGTGRNLPTRAEILGVLERSGLELAPELSRLLD
jgi:sugar/nucleoside kinase (ribokinase family)